MNFQTSDDRKELARKLRCIAEFLERAGPCEKQSPTRVLIRTQDSLAEDMIINITKITISGKTQNGEAVDADAEDLEDVTLDFSPESYRGAIVAFAEGRAA